MTKIDYGLPPKINSRRADSTSVSTRASHSSIPNRISRSRTGTRTTKQSASSKLQDGHIEFNPAALESFLNQYASDIDELNILDTVVNFDPLQCSPSLRSSRSDERENGAMPDGCDNVSAIYGSAYSSSSPWASCLEPPMSNNNGFDLIATVPFSGLAQYLPSVDFALDLLDTYFLETPSARLMFDQQAVIRRYMSSTLPHQILFSILALASLFRGASASPAQQNHKDSPARNIQEQGRVWAELASDMVLTKSDVSSLTVIRTSEQISLYWFAVGERDRANIHADVAYQVYKAMASSHPDREIMMNFNRAMWLHDCFAEYQMSYYDSDRFRLLYPKYNSFMEEHGFRKAGAALGLRLRDTWGDRPPVDLYTSTSYAVGAVGLWREVNAFVRETINGPINMGFVFPALEARLKAFSNALPSSIRANCLMDFQLAGPAQSAMLCFALVNCANTICLHSCKISHLSNMKPNTTADQTEASTQIVLNMAHTAGDMIHDHISNFSKERKTPPMIAYCVFAIGSVHAHMSEFRDDPGRSEAWIRGVSCLLLLEYMRTYWPVLDKLCKNLRRRFSYSDPNILTISTEQLWQLASRPQLNLPQATTNTTSTTTTAATDLTPSLFSIPHSSSFVQEMLGLDLPPDEVYPSLSALQQDQCRHEKDAFGGDVNSNSHSMDGYDFVSDISAGLEEHRLRGGSTGMIGTEPPTIAFEANLVGLMPLTGL